MKYLFFFLAIATAFACSQPEVNPLCQTWEVSDITYEQPTADSASMLMLESMKTMMKGTKYAFTVNGEYEISGPSSSKKGTYVVSEDKQHFTLGEGGDQLNFDIVELSPTKLRFKNPKMPVVLVCTPSASASK